VHTVVELLLGLLELAQQHLADDLADLAAANGSNSRLKIKHKHRGCKIRTAAHARSAMPLKSTLTIFTG
jgi:hypothetical protein